MNIFDDLKSFSFSPNKNKLFGIKSGIVWGNSKNTNSSYPILYISKPKHISQEDFELMLDCIDIQFVKKK
jgi:hypothetical protein